MLQSQQDYLKLEPYAFTHEEKNLQFKKFMNELTRYHYKNCSEYARMLDAQNFSAAKDYELEELPFLPVGLFKEYELKSVPQEKIVKTMKSSGTSGQKQAKVLLDSETSRAQMRCLSNIMSSFIGKKRLPMIILDTELAKKDPRLFSARGAGIIGFSVFGRDIFFALDENMNLRLDELKKFLEVHADSKIILFGYTYIVWQFFAQELKRQGIFLNIADGNLFHIGGWKKLQAQSVTGEKFRGDL